MKVLFITLFFIPCVLFGQQKKDSKIIVSVTDTTNLFNRVVLALYEKGYTLDTKDQSVGFIKTNEKEMENYSPFQTITIFIKSNTMTFTSKMRFGTLGTFDVIYTGERKNAYVAAWNEINDIAKQFGGVSYSK